MLPEQIAKHSFNFNSAKLAFSKHGMDLVDFLAKLPVRTRSDTVQLLQAFIGLGRVPNPQPRTLTGDAWREHAQRTGKPLDMEPVTVSYNPLSLDLHELRGSARQ